MVSLVRIVDEWRSIVTKVVISSAVYFCWYCRNTFGPPSHIGHFAFYAKVLDITNSRVTLYTAGHLHTAVSQCSHSRASIVHTAVPRENNEHGCVYLRCRAVCKLPGYVEGHPWNWYTCFAYSLNMFLMFGGHNVSHMYLCWCSYHYFRLHMIRVHLIQ